MSILTSKRICFIITVVLLFAVSFGIYQHGMKGHRFVFLFPAGESAKTVMEVRYLRKSDTLSLLQTYVDEMLLGSSISRASRLFAAHTRTIFCFEREKTVYINLSKDALFQTSDAVPLLRGIELFKQNIQRNFRYINKIELFVDGRPVE